MEHIPVLLQEVISNLNIRNDGNYVDLTIGRAGHSSEILKKLQNGHLYGFDQDDDAIKESTENLNKVGFNFTLFHTNFVNAKSELEKLGLVGKVDGILMDLGVSSPQFDEGNRGFSYRTDAPLDMRMDQRQSLTAAIVVNTYDFKALVNIFKEYGDEKYSISIANNIIKNRPINTTFELVDVIKKSKPAKGLRKEGHPAKQVFQALRIEVNNELNVLKDALVQITSLLAPKGRLLIITFHSGEDRIVKTIFRDLTTTEGNRLNLPTKVEEKEYVLITHKPIVASADELLNNNRAHSAKLRIIERK